MCVQDGVYRTIRSFGECKWPCSTAITHICTGLPDELHAGHACWGVHSVHCGWWTESTVWRANCFNHLVSKIRFGPPKASGKHREKPKFTNRKQTETIDRNDFLLQSQGSTPSDKRLECANIFPISSVPASSLRAESAIPKPPLKLNWNSLSTSLCLFGRRVTRSDSKIPTWNIKIGT